MKKLVIITLIGFSFLSCKKDIYHSFTDEEKAFLVYDQGETFKLKNESTEEILEFTVSSKIFKYKKDTGPTSGGRKTHYMEEGELNFSAGNPENSGYIYIKIKLINIFQIFLLE